MLIVVVKLVYLIALSCFFSYTISMTSTSQCEKKHQTLALLFRGYTSPVAYSILMSSVKYTILRDAHFHVMGDVLEFLCSLACTLDHQILLYLLI